MYHIHEQHNASDFNNRELQRLGLLGKPYILGLRFRLSIPFQADVSSNLYIQRKGEEFPTLVKSDVKTPYPNKSVHALYNKVGRKQSKEFLPIPFDSFEELQGRMILYGE